MKNDLIGIYDHATGENIIREMTSEEQSARNAEIAADLAMDAAIKAEALAKAEAKSALLAKLGITEDEAKSLLN